MVLAHLAFFQLGSFPFGVTQIMGHLPTQDPFVNPLGQLLKQTSGSRRLFRSLVLFNELVQQARIDPWLFSFLALARFVLVLGHFHLFTSGCDPHTKFSDTLRWPAKIASIMRKPLRPLMSLTT